MPVTAKILNLNFSDILLGRDFVGRIVNIRYSGFIGNESDSGTKNRPRIALLPMSSSCAIANYDNWRLKLKIPISLKPCSVFLRADI